jgi:hypothetical protein
MVILSVSWSGDCYDSPACDYLREERMQSQILLVVFDEIRRGQFENFFKKERVICQAVTSLRDVSTQIARQPYNAIFLDMALITGASPYEKSLVKDVLHAMPHASLDITATNEISIVVSGDASESSHSPEEYLRYCCEQPIQTVAPQNRIQMNFNAVLSRTPDITHAERTVCIDISPGGCFLFCVNDDITLHSHVWVNLIILNDSTPIPATVCWKREWGMTNDIPGVGVRFESMTVQQQTEILALCRKK